MAVRLVFGVSAADEGPGTPFVPSIPDILHVKLIFSRTPLPIEIIDLILESAEYWPKTSQSTRYERSSPSGKLTVAGASSNQDSLLLRCCPLGFARKPGSPSRPGDYLYGSLPQSKLRPLRRQCSSSDFHPYLPSNRNLRRLDHPCRKIIFTITSHDQGWANPPRPPNPFEDSHTWFEVGLERFEKEDICTDGCKDSSPDPSRPLSQNSNYEARVEPRTNKSSPGKAKYQVDTLSLCHLRPVIPSLRHCTTREKAELHLARDEEAYKYEFPNDPNPSLKIQTNKRASRMNGTFEIEWNYKDHVDAKSSQAQELLVLKGRGAATGDGKFLRSLKLGDVITVWGKARYPGWVNHIDMVKVDIYWAV